MAQESGQEPTALLLLPRAVDSAIQRDQVLDLLRSPGVEARGRTRIPYGVVGRLPMPLARRVAQAQARFLRVRGRPRVFVIWHPLQQPLGAALLERFAGSELWYVIWDRYAEAADAGPRMRRRLARLHDRAASQAALVWAISPAYAADEAAAGREAVVAPSAADSFPAVPVPGLPDDLPAPARGARIVAVSLGNLGRRTDWGLLRELADGIDGLAIVLVGRLDETGVAGDPDLAACRDHPRIVWAGFREDEEAARILAAADAGLMPFRRDRFNEGALPNRILKAARMGRPTVVPAWAAVDVWERAVVRAEGAGTFAQALEALAGARDRPDLELRDWALGQTAERNDAPIWERLLELGIAAPR
jgi:glycosyltransferase involved in cell wall biosynthesis